MASAGVSVIQLLAIAVALTGCVRTSARDLDLGANRYLVTADGNSNASLATLEQVFAQRARETAQQHGFDSYRVVEFGSGFERTPFGSRPVAKGVVQLYNAGNPAGGRTTGRPADGGTATAFTINADGVLLTNAHVAQDCREISVRQFDGTISPASLLAADRTNDLALIKLASPTPVAAQLRGNPEIRQGDNVIAVGFPLSDTLSSGTATTLTTGTVSALAGIGNDSRVLQVSAPIQPGNSGGPLLDQSGHVVAIVSSRLNGSAAAVSTGNIPQNVNFAIKASVARAFMDAVGIAYRVAPSEREMSTAEIGDQARKFTSFVTCTL
jgi:S1-C subfamily serine protease